MAMKKYIFGIFYFSLWNIQIILKILKTFYCYGRCNGLSYIVYDMRYFYIDNWYANLF